MTTDTNQIQQKQPNQPKKDSTPKTLEQQIAEKQDELNRLKAKKEDLSNAQKIVIGGMMIAKARKNPQVARQLLADIETEVNRDTDKKRLSSVVNELKEFINSTPNQTQN